MMVNIKDHVEGGSNASVELIEYGDYQCPYCAQAYYIIKDIQEDLGDDLKFVFRNFPLEELHPNALHAAIAAETAAELGKFWEMHNILYENQQYLEDENLIEYAKEIGLSVSQFEKDFGNNLSYDKVKRDYESGVKNGVEGTPTFFVNGRIFTGDWSSGEFKHYLKSLVK